ncbi:MAG: T9SS type A sorting domain-containing protein, partial [Calditrichia bacterium]|nr:T9SS type A sorting domain-containing protein [Calditrichia bacterium]
QNYPNPFNPKTTIDFNLTKSSKVSLVIYNLLGEKIKTLINENMSASQQSEIWDATDDYGDAVPTGVYIYRLKTSEGNLQKKMLFLK